MNLSIIGLGKLGAPMAAVLAHKGHTVAGVDANPDFVAAIQQGLPPVREPGLADMISANRARLSATADCEEAVLCTDATYIMVPTPSGADGRFSLDYVMSAAAGIGAALRKKDAWHLVVLSSTVMPGATGCQLLPALEAHSGKQCGRDFGICYNPEFVALGSVIRDMLNPDMILIGESDARSGDLLEALYTGVCESNPRIQRMNFVNAELTKLSVNTFVTTRISYANMLAEVCETIPGADVDVVTDALGCDSRIGKKYLKGALGYGGPCFPRDNAAFAALARGNGVRAYLAEATDRTNCCQVPRLAAITRRHLPEGGVAGILGLSYKPHTDVVEESQGLALAKQLAEAGERVVVYDPAAMENARPHPPRPSLSPPLPMSAAEASVLVITTPWPEFRNLSTGKLAGTTVLDCWRILDADAVRAVANYVTLALTKPHLMPFSASSSRPPRPRAEKHARYNEKLASRMTPSAPSIDRVHDYWNARPCNIRHSPKPVGTREYFDEVEARKYFVESHIPRFAEFERRKGKKVLEIGCGIGTDTISFARAGAHVTAVDLTEKSLAVARRRAAVFGLEDRIRFIQADAERLGDYLAPETYDLVYSFGVIHHTPSPAAVIEEIRKFTGPSSTVKIMLYHRWSWKVLWILFVYGKGRFWELDRLIARYSEAQTGCPVTFSYSRAGARRLLEDHGFAVTGVVVDHIFPYSIPEYREFQYKKVWYFRWMPAGLFAFLSRSFGWHVCLTAKRK